MFDSQGSRPDFRYGQGVKHENLLGQDLDRSRGWKYRCLCNAPPPKGCGGTCEAYDVVTYTLQLASSCIFHI